MFDRSLDGSPATLDVLAAIVEAVNHTDIPVFLDGGIRAGMDVFKAVALGEWFISVDGARGGNQLCRTLT